MQQGRLALTALSALALAVALPALAADTTGAPPAAPAAAQAPLFPEGPLFTPAPKPTAPECHFCSSTLTTSPGGGAASHWGHGATCTDAQNDVKAQLSAAVNAECDTFGTAGRCAFSVVYTCACYQQNGQWVVDAYANYRCWVYYC